MKKSVKIAIAGGAGILLAVALSKMAEENEVKTASNNTTELDKMQEELEAIKTELAATKQAFNFTKFELNQNFVNKLEAEFQKTPDWSTFTGSTFAGSEGAWLGLRRSFDYDIVCFCQIVSFDRIYSATRNKNGVWKFNQFLNQNNIV